MLDRYIELMRVATVWRTVAAFVVIFVAPLAASAQRASPSDRPDSGAEVVTLAPPSPLVKLLPDTLAGLKATSETKQVTRDNLIELVAEKAPVYQEYLVVSAASREYPGSRVDVFETRNQFAALGLFAFNTGAHKIRPVEITVGSGGARADGELFFWKGNLFVCVKDVNHQQARGRSGVQEALARAVAEAIVPEGSGVMRPPLFDSLPIGFAGASLTPESQRYFLGSESLSAFVEHGREMFQFVGDTEAVVGEYTKAEAEKGGGAPIGQGPGQTKSVSAQSAPAAALKLVIVECHTPEFATDELARIAGYVSSLSEVEQQRIVFKRTGNYIVAAVNVREREFAEGLVNSVQYPYTVKWLRNPLWPANDPFRTQKAAEMLLSTFGLLGLILLTVLVGGTVFGTTVFLRRRRQQREIFSDAGGMLRLDIEPFVLALPPKRSEE